MAAHRCNAPPRSRPATSRESETTGKLLSSAGMDVTTAPAVNVPVPLKPRHGASYLKNPPVVVLDLVFVIRRQMCMAHQDGGGAEWGNYEGSSFLMNAQQKHSGHSPFQKQFDLLPYPRGITNSSNFCFMNSILQALLFIPPFTQLALSVSELASPIVSQRCPTLMALSRWFVLYWREDGVTQRSVPPPRLSFFMAPTRSQIVGGVAVAGSSGPACSHSTTHTRAHCMNGSTQQDAQEFLQKLLETINVELFFLEVAVWESGACNVDEFIDYEEKRVNAKGGSSNTAHDDGKHSGIVSNSGGNCDSSRSVSRRKHGAGASLEVADGMRSGDVSTTSGGGGKMLNRCVSHSGDSQQVKSNNCNNTTNNNKQHARREDSTNSNDLAKTVPTKKGFKEQQHQSNRAGKKWTFIKDNERLAVREHIDSKGSSSTLQHIFGGTIESHLKGGRSRQRNITSVLVEHYYSLPIDIGFAAECTLEEAIEHSCTTERIYDEDRDKDMRKSLLLSQLPNILFIHVMRWAITAEGETVKLDNVLHFKRTLVIPQGACADKLTNQARSYSLLSVIAHRGSGVEVGHYITYLAKYAASPFSPLQPGRDAKASAVTGTAKTDSASKAKGKGGVHPTSSASNQSSAHVLQQQQQRSSPSSEYVLLCNDAMVRLCPASDMFNDSVYFLVYQKTKQQ